MVKFSELDVCKRFVNKDKNKIIVYIENLYRKDSELNNIQNLSERKRAACEKAKLNPKDTEVLSIMDLQHEEVNKLIFAFLSTFQNSNSYHKLMSDQQLFWDIQKILMSPAGVDDEDELMSKYKKRGELSKTSDELLIRINRLYSEIFTEEETQDMAHTIVRQMMRPEERVRNKEQNKENV